MSLSGCTKDTEAPTSKSEPERVVYEPLPTIDWSNYRVYDPAKPDFSTSAGIVEAYDDVLDSYYSCKAKLIKLKTQVIKNEKTAQGMLDAARK